MVGTSTIQALDPRPLATRHKIGLVGLAALAILPLFADRITILRVTAALYLGMFAMSWDSVSGYTGEISFGHAFFFAIGGYTSALLNLNFGWSPLITIIVGILMAVLGGLLIGVPSLRLSGPYFSLITLIAPLLLFQFFVYYSEIFGGETGLRNPENLIAIQNAATRELAQYYATFAIFLLILGVLWAVTRTNAGAVFYAIQGGEDIVASTGKNPAKFKIFAFVLSAAVGGLAGGAYVHTVGGPTPSELILLEINLIVIIAAVLGGMGTIVGAAIGGMFIHLVDVSVVNQIRTEIPILEWEVHEMSFLIVGLLGLILIYVLPGGILRWAIRNGRRIQDTGLYSSVAGQLGGKQQ